MNPPIIWIIDNNHWERASLGALLIERGYAAEGFSSIFHATSTLYGGLVEKPAVIVLETVNLDARPEELDEVVRHGAPIVLLTGVFNKAPELLEKHKWAKVLRRPFTVGQVADAVEALVVR